MLITTYCSIAKHIKTLANSWPTYLIRQETSRELFVQNEWMWGKELGLIKYLELYSKLNAKQLLVVFTKIFSLWMEHYYAALCFRVNYHLHSSPHWLNWNTERPPLGCSLPTVLWVAMLSCLTYFTNHPQTTHHIPLRFSTYMLSTGSPQCCVLLKSWGLTTLRSAAFFLSVNRKVMQKVQQQLHFHILRRNRVEQRLLMSFYFITI